MRSTVRDRELRYGHHRKEHGYAMRMPGLCAIPDRSAGARILAQQPISEMKFDSANGDPFGLPHHACGRRHLARELHVPGVIFAALVRDLDTRCDNVNGSALAGLALDPRLVGE